MKNIIKQLNDKQDLSVEQAKQVLTTILLGNHKNQDIEDFLIAFENKPYHWQEFLGFTQAMKACCKSLDTKIKKPIMDVCGTGGSGKNRFNISTSSAFVLSAADIYIAKHGNYGSKRPNGSFNFLEELNIPFQFQPEGLLTLLKQAKCCFLFARYFHPGMRHVVGARKKINTQTIFNYLGPLVNPISLNYQLIGLSTNRHLQVLIETANHLPDRDILFCIGGDGRDEVSLEGITTFAHVTNGKTREFDFNFSKEIEVVDPNYDCGDSNDNALTFINICIEENWDHPIIKHISINAAAAMLCYGDVESLVEGYEKALSLFKTLRVTQAINRYKEVASTIK